MKRRASPLVPPKGNPLSPRPSPNWALIISVSAFTVSCLNTERVEAQLLGLAVLTAFLVSLLREQKP